MPTYRYTARTMQGEQVTGVLDADSSAAAARALDDKKLFPVEVTEQASPAARAGGFGGGRVRTRDVGLTYGQLADLLKSGVPLLRAIDTLSRAGSNPALSAVLKKVRDDVAAGKPLADAFGAHPNVFPSLHAAMVRAGERGGFLEDVLANLAAFIERQDELAGKVTGALIYPIILVCIGAIVLVALLLGMVPQFKPIFKGVPLPPPTMLLFALSDLLIEQWLPLLVVVVVVVGGTIVFFLSPAGVEMWDRGRLKIPILGKAIRMSCVTRLCRILGTMLANGVPLLQALAISRDAAGSIVLAEAIDQAAESVRGGQTLAQPLAASGMFPLEVIEMIAVAEESNMLEKVLVQIADTVERRTARQVDQVVRLVEPAILVMLASVIGFVAVSLLYPIFTMSKALK